MESKRVFNVRKDRLLATAKRKGLTTQQLAQAIGRREITFLRKLEDWRFSIVELDKLSETLSLYPEERACLFYREIPANIPTLNGVPYPLKAFPKSYSTLITLDDGTTWKLNTALTIERVNTNTL